MKSISTLDAKEQLNELLNHVSHHKEPIILTRRDKEIAAIIPIEDLALLIESQDRHDLTEASESLKQAKQQGFKTLASLKAAIGQ